MDAFFGEIRLFPFKYVPQNWIPCDGRLLQTRSYPALFALLGKTFGGDGSTTFALPDLRGRTVMGAGAGKNLTPRAVGDKTGTETVSLNSSNFPAHTHSVTVKNGTEGSPMDAPDNSFFLQAPRTTKLFNPALTTGMTLAPTVVGQVGSAKPRANMQPYLVMAYCICVENGIWPERP
ncbi:MULTISPECIES: phage tail protein [Pseudomonas]|jgi:microcystin-dependent protein|uniref:Tail fiber protein n=1 Tax=Pseudomonas sichuanensis TaxID=2213015 RepID=A0ABV0DPN4_9PSED|nr:tail fiber protein [Pseudomonas sichuanensis]